MSAESELYDLLTTAAGVTALVGAQVYPDLVPQGKEPPYVGFERVSTVPVATIHGTVLANEVAMTVACWAATRLAAEGLADAVDAAMLAAGHIYTARGAEIDEATNRVAATLDYLLLIQ